MGMMAMTSCHAAVPHGVNRDVHFFPMSGSWNGTAVNLPSMSYYQVRINLTPQQEDEDKWRLQIADCSGRLLDKLTQRGSGTHLPFYLPSP
jgi:hypothetical protein